MRQADIANAKIRLTEAELEDVKVRYKMQPTRDTAQQNRSLQISHLEGALNTLQTELSLVLRDKHDTTIADQDQSASHLDTLQKIYRMRSMVHESDAVRIATATERQHLAELVILD